jgi:hypothetical protein
MTKSPNPKARDASRAPNDFGRLARRMADWTTKGLFSALVIVGGLGFGREVIRWWREDEAAAPGAAPSAPGFDSAAEGEPIDIAAGDSNVQFGRERVAGDLEAARKSLRALCLRALAAASPWSPSADDEEQRLLAGLAELEPVMLLEQANARLYEPAPGAPLVVGVRRFADARKGGSENATSSHDRVVLWGLAAPAAPGEWTLYRFCADSPAPSEKGGSSPPLPADGRRIMAFRDRRGSETIAFQGTAGCSEYRRFYQAWQAEQGSQLTGQWHRTDDGGWQVSLVRGASSDGAEGPQSILIHLAPGRFGGCTGLVFVLR